MINESAGIESRGTPATRTIRVSVLVGERLPGERLPGERRPGETGRIGCVSLRNTQYSQPGCVCERAPRLVGATASGGCRASWRVTGRHPRSTLHSSNSNMGTHRSCTFIALVGSPAVPPPPTHTSEQRTPRHSPARHPNPQALEVAATCMRAWHWRWFVWETSLSPNASRLLCSSCAGGIRRFVGGVQRQLTLNSARAPPGSHAGSRLG